MSDAKNIYPFKFTPIYKERIWGGRNFERLLGRRLPGRAAIGESWELSDIAEGVSVVANGPAAGTTLTGLTRTLGRALLGGAAPMPDGRFPILLKFLDANERLSLQVHPDAAAAARIGGGAAEKTECWHVIESRGGCICKGVSPGVRPAAFRKAIADNTLDRMVRRYEVAAGDFHYLPAGVVHALGAGVVVAEVQTPSDTTYRVTDWGRGRELHVEQAMQCIQFAPADDVPPGAAGERLLESGAFTVHLRHAARGEHALACGRCTAWMVLSGRGAIGGRTFAPVEFSTGDTILIPAALADLTLALTEASQRLEITLP